MINLLFVDKQYLFYKNYTFCEISHYLSQAFRSYTCLDLTVTSFELYQLINPTNSSIINCLSNIISHIKSPVICLRKYEYYISLPLVYFRYFNRRGFLFDNIWIDKSRFMPEEMPTLHFQLRKDSFHNLLKFFEIIRMNSIPYFCRTLMQNIDCR